MTFKPLAPASVAPRADLTERAARSLRVSPSYGEVARSTSHGRAAVAAVPARVASGRSGGSARWNGSQGDRAISAPSSYRPRRPRAGALPRGPSRGASCLSSRSRARWGCGSPSSGAPSRRAACVRARPPGPRTSRCRTARLPRPVSCRLLLGEWRRHLETVRAPSRASARAPSRCGPDRRVRLVERCVYELRHVERPRLLGGDADRRGRGAHEHVEVASGDFRRGERNVEG